MPARTRVPRGQVGVEGRHAPVVAAAGRLGGARERRADHDGVGADGDGLGEVATGAHAAVGDDVAVLAGLLEEARAGGGRVSDRGGLRDADAEHAARGARVAGADAHEHADGAGAHEVQRALVAAAAADDARDVERLDERVEVERLVVAAHVLGRDDRALDDEDVEPAGERGLEVALAVLRRERGGGDDAAVLDLLARAW